MTLIQAWIAAGKPEPHYPSLGSYEAWSRVMGGILAVAGIPGFLGNLDRLYDDVDTETAAWDAFARRWWETFADTPVGVAQLFDLATGTEGFELRGADERAQRKSFGMALKHRRDTILGAFRIESAGKTQGVGQWRLRHIAGS